MVKIFIQLIYLMKVTDRKHPINIYYKGKNNEFSTV